jgi:hypothetical protein
MNKGDDGGNTGNGKYPVRRQSRRPPLLKKGEFNDNGDNDYPVRAYGWKQSFLPPLHRRAITATAQSAKTSLLSALLSL